MTAPIGGAALSFVVPAVNEYSDLQKTLGALHRESSDVALDVIVVSRLGTAFGDRARAEFPWVRVLDVASDMPIPQMRAAGFAVTKAPRVAVIEDHVQVPAGWGKRALALSTPEDVVSAGPVMNLATSTLIDRVAFLCEYSHCLPPVASGVSDWLPGNSVVYPAPLLSRHSATVAAGGWENELHESMKREGATLRFASELEIGHDKHYSFWEYFSQRYIYARSYAANRVRGQGFAGRVARSAATVALPAILLLRIAQRAWARPPYRSTFLAGLPLLTLFVTSWAAGEIAGYLLGGGDALSRVR